LRPLDEFNQEDTELLICRVRIKLIIKARFFISLYHLQCLPLVRPIGEVEVVWLQNEFIMGYRDDVRVMYVFSYINFDEVVHIFDDIRTSGSLL
jgi:hypothetical protein